MSKRNIVIVVSLAGTLASCVSTGGPQQIGPGLGRRGRVPRLEASPGLPPN
jgi:hypothetical protein